MVVDGHGCYTALHFSVKHKENQDIVATLYWLHKLHKNHINHGLLLILALVNLMSYSCSKHVIKYCEKCMRDPVQIYSGLLKIQVSDLKRIFLLQKTLKKRSAVAQW